MIGAVLYVILGFTPSPDPRLIEHRCYAFTRAIGINEWPASPPKQVECTMQTERVIIEPVREGEVLMFCIYAHTTNGDSECALWKE